MTTARQRRGLPERHHAISLDGRVMTFECPRGHRYEVDYDHRRHDRKIGTEALKMFLRYWRPGGGGVSAYPIDCPTCRRAMPKEDR